MKSKVLVFILAAAVAAFAQGRSGGHAGGPPAGVGGGMSGSSMGNGHGMGGPSSTGPSTNSNSNRGSEGMSQTQQPLKDSQVNGGAFRMLENKTGMTQQQLQDLYASSGAKNFGQFVSAIVVSKNLGLDTTKVLDGLKTMSLGQTLQSLGVSSKDAKSEIKKANQQIKDAKKNG